MTEKKPFAIDVGKLRSREKVASASAVERVDRVAEDHGFIAREPAKRRGRLPSPRTGQLHAKVFPDVSDEIAKEATRRGVTQGVVIEEAWKLYKENNPV
mgnify:CR=1 FL=1